MTARGRFFRICWLSAGVYASQVSAQALPDQRCVEDTLTELPPTVSLFSGDGGAPMIHVQTGTKGVDLPTLAADVGAFRQVCRLSGDRLLLVSGDGLRSVEIVDLKHAVVTDRFLAYFPSLSPDRRWIALRRFFPSHGIADASDQYFVYDTLKDAAGNRDSGAKPSPVRDGVFNGWVGKEVYPVEVQPWPNHVVPKGEQHSSASSFHWSADSNALLFADSARDGDSLVLVLLSNGAARAFIHRVDDAFAAIPRDSDVRITPLQSDQYRILVHRCSGCVPLDLSPADFEPAKPQKHANPIDIPASDDTVVIERIMIDGKDGYRATQKKK